MNIEQVTEYFEKREKHLETCIEDWNESNSAELLRSVKIMEPELEKVQIVLSALRAQQDDAQHVGVARLEHGKCLAEPVGAVSSGADHDQYAVELRAEQRRVGDQQGGRAVHDDPVVARGEFGQQLGESRSLQEFRRVRRSGPRRYDPGL